MTTTEDFDEYIPVFLYSHASFADYNEDCKLADPNISGEVTKEGLFKSFETEDDFFTTVPENMVLVDPIPSGLLCMSGWSVDELFPWFVSSFGNKTFLQKDLPINDIKEYQIESEDIDVLQHLYNNRKIYYSGDEVNNFRITFDINSGPIPWGVRVPIYENKDQTIFNAYSGVSNIEMVGEEWSRQYSDSKKNECIYLDQVLIKIREFVDNIYKHKPKIMLYMISCRNQPDYDYQYQNNPILKERLLQRQLMINMNGKNNVPYGATSDRKLRGQKTFIFDEGANYSERLDSIQRASANTRKRKKGGKKRYNNKRTTRKKQYRKRKKISKKAINVEKRRTTRKGKRIKSTRV